MWIGGTMMPSSSASCLRSDAIAREQLAAARRVDHAEQVEADLEDEQLDRQRGLELAAWARSSGLRGSGGLAGVRAVAGWPRSARRPSPCDAAQHGDAAEREEQDVRHARAAGRSTTSIAAVTCSGRLRVEQLAATARGRARRRRRGS